MNKIFFDTEFQEDGNTIELISIGMVRDTGEMLYLENAEYDINKAEPWLKKHVVPHLWRTASVVLPRRSIAERVLKFVGHKPEFWSYCADYDWVVLCQLFGRMVDLPKDWPHYCNDIKQIAKNVDLPDQVTIRHHALYDAIWHKECYEYLEAMKGEVPTG